MEAVLNSCAVVSVLHVVKLEVFTRERHQLLVLSLFNDSAFGDHDNPVGIADGGSLLNLKFHPTSMKDLSGLRKLAALIRAHKGQHVQFNIVSAETLRNAQKQPESYVDLMVRVAGFSALFVGLDPQVQNDIIARTEHVL